MAPYLVHAPANTALEAMVKAAGSRWPVEECFESGKSKVGLGDYEVRSYTGWYHHMTLCVVAHAQRIRWPIRRSTCLPQKPWACRTAEAG